MRFPETTWTKWENAPIIAVSDRHGEVVETTLVDGLLLLLIAAAVVFDVKSRKIPNQLIAAGLLSGLVYRVYSNGMQGLGAFLGNAVFPVLILYLLFLIHALGAGDIKLFSVIGVCTSFSFLISCMLFSFLAGAVLSVVQMVKNRNFWYRLNVFCQYSKDVLSTGRLREYPHEEEGACNVIHFSVAVFIGVCIEMGVCYWG